MCENKSNKKKISIEIESFLKQKVCSSSFPILKLDSRYLCFRHSLSGLIFTHLLMIGTSSYEMLSYHEKWSKRISAITTARCYLGRLALVDTKLKQNINQNTHVYADMILVCKEDVIFGIADEATLIDFPRRSARIAWEALK
jgi:hypothetical protein